MIEIDFNDQKQFSDFVERFKTGKTTKKEESSFGRFINSVKKDIESVLKIDLNNLEK